MEKQKRNIIVISDDQSSRLLWKYAGKKLEGVKIITLNFKEVEERLESNIFDNSFIVREFRMNRETENLLLKIEEKHPLSKWGVMSAEGPGTLKIDCPILQKPFKVDDVLKFVKEN